MVGSMTVTFDDVRTAAGRIAGRVHRTPVLTSSTLDAELGCSVFVKCENLQKVGAFKARGALNTVLSLSDEQAHRGVIAHSSGNHAAALAWAAQSRDIPCTVVMPQTASKIKVAATQGYGAEVRFCKEGEREQACAEAQKETGATFVHPNADPRVIAGQGTVALELLEEVSDLDAIIAPVGGGGLLCGSVIAARGAKPGVEVFGAEPELVDDAFRSLQSGERQPAVAHPKSCADGLLTCLGELNFSILREFGVEIVTVTEDAIVAASRFYLECMKLVVEPSGATSAAGLRVLAERMVGQRVGVIISGGNTDFAWL